MILSQSESWLQHCKNQQLGVEMADEIQQTATEMWGKGDFYIWNMLFIYESAIEEQDLGILTGLEKYNFNGN